MSEYASRRTRDPDGTRSHQKALTHPGDGRKRISLGNLKENLVPMRRGDRKQRPREDDERSDSDSEEEEGYYRRHRRRRRPQVRTP